MSVSRLPHEEKLRKLGGGAGFTWESFRPAMFTLNKDFLRTRRDLFKHWLF